LKILWIDDSEIAAHPIANQLLVDLKRNQVDVTLISADKVNNERSFRNPGKKWLADYVRRRARRKRKWIPFIDRIKVQKSARKKMHRLLDAFNNLDKHVTKYRHAKIGRIYSLKDGMKKLLLNRDEFQIVMFMRPYLIPYILLKKITSKNRKATIIYYSFELYGEQYHRKYSKVVRAIELMLLRQSKLILFTQNEERRNFYLDRGFRGESYLVGNYKTPNSEVLTCERKYTETRILSFSSIRSGLMIEKILEWLIEESSGIVLTLMGEVSTKWENDNSKIIEEGIGRGVLKLEERITPDQFSDILPRYDIGLITFESNCKNHLYCAPAKLTDYLHVGLPILASRLPSLEIYSSQFDFIKLFDSNNKNEFFNQVASLQKFKDEESRLRVRKESSILSWGNEFGKIAHLFKKN
jgi:hypothetical protein